MKKKRADDGNSQKRPTGRRESRILDRIEQPADLRRLRPEDLAQLAQECRETIIETISKTGGHLASNLGVVELTLALHRAFDSPRDRRSATSAPVRPAAAVTSCGSA